MSVSERTEFPDLTFFGSHKMSPCTSSICTSQSASAVCTYRCTEVAGIFGRSVALWLFVSDASLDSASRSMEKKLNTAKPSSSVAGSCKQGFYMTTVYADYFAVCLCYLGTHRGAHWPQPIFSLHCCANSFASRQPIMDDTGFGAVECRFVASWRIDTKTTLTVHVEFDLRQMTQSDTAMMN